MQRRIDELHEHVFTPPEQLRFKTPMETIITDRLAYRVYHQRLRALGYGRDYSGLPQLQLPMLMETPEPGAELY